MKSRIFIWYFVLIIVVVLSGSTAYTQITGTPDNIKSSFIYHFTGYLSWPDISEEDDFRIVILGDSPIINPLQYIAETRKVDNKPIQLKKVDKLNEVNDCHILIISEKMTPQLEAILKRDDLKQTVIITQCGDCLKRGASINFVNVNDQIRFEINRTSLENKGIKINSQLLKLALQVI